ncbi:MAG: beta-ketoacyl-[acyl-carrier-protein] synthase family protein [Ruminococcus sp.]|nr:beta-ketoacyl-[acyl-carrier-protein] synthase family protein [Ruminococcus sp.]
MYRVVVTGIAPIASIGMGESFFDALFSGKTVISRMEPDYCMGEPSTEWYVPYPKVDIKSYGRDFVKMMMMASPNACLAAVSAVEALRDSGLEKADEDAAVYFGVGAPHAGPLLNAYEALGDEAPLHPCTNPMIMSNSVSAWIAMILGIHGVNQVISTACASGTNAVGEAYEHIRSGRGRMAVCGGSDDLRSKRGVLMRSFDVLGALTKSKDGLPRPFSEERSGFLFSEGGACALILEEYESAVKRGADIYAEITGYSASCDAYHIVQMPEKPVQIVNMLSELAHGEKVDYYNAHGTATELNDKTERYVLGEVFGDAVSELRVSSTKGLIGHSIGASGAIEAAVCAYSVKNDIVHGTPTGTSFPELNIPRSSEKARIECAISASFGFGGHNAALKFKKV